MIQLKDVNFTDSSTIDVGAIVENMQMLAEEIDTSRMSENVIPAGFGTMSCPICERGTHQLVPKGHPRMEFLNAHCVLGDNIKQSVKVSLLVNEKKIGSIKFAANERSGKIQVFEIPEGTSLGTFDEINVRTSDDRRIVAFGSFISEEVTL